MGFRGSRVPLVLVALLARHTGVLGKSIHSFAGPWTANVERFSMCEEPNRPLLWRWFFRTSHFNPQKPTELQLLTGNLTGRDVPYDDSVWLKILFALWSNNQWKENSFVMYFKDNACSNVRDQLFPDFYHKVFKKTDTKGWCSIKPGEYEVNNVPINWKYPKVPVMPYGLYRQRITAGKKDKLYECLVVQVRIMPKIE